MKSVFGLLIAIVPASAYAQTSDDSAAVRNTTSPSSAVPAASPPGEAAPPPATVPQSDNPYARFDAIRPKGWDTPFPQIGDTILQDTGGIRSALADAGIGILGLSANTGVYNLRHDDTPGAVYNGRRPTYQVGIQCIFLSFDTGKIGLDNGQLLVTAASLTNGLKPIDGPRFTRITNIAYYQQLDGGKIEIKVGYLDNFQEYVGTAVAGSLASGNLGPQAQIPVELGFGYNGIGAPSLNVRLNGKDGLYTKFGVQRSLPPGGANAEVPLNNAVGLKFSLPGAGALFVDEVGINRPAKEGEKSLWFRAGGIYNTTKFTDFRTGRGVANWALYAAVDRQLTQTDPAMPFRGLYAGASVNYAPTRQNLYSQYYEGRIYGIGLIRGRPFDLASIVASYTGLSHSALAAIAPGERTQKYSAAIIGSYSYRIRGGLYFQPGLGLGKNPTYTPKVPLAINGYLSITMLL